MLWVLLFQILYAYSNASQRSIQMKKINKFAKVTDHENSKRVRNNIVFIHQHRYKSNRIELSKFLIQNQTLFKDTNETHVQ